VRVRPLFSAQVSVEGATFLRRTQQRPDAARYGSSPDRQGLRAIVETRTLLP
jgi:hypothetical protein